MDGVYSTIPVVKFTPLGRFLSLSENGRVLVRRLRAGLSPEEMQRLCGAAESRMGKLCHLGFNCDSPRQFCAKFVYDTLLETTGYPVGWIETFRELFSANPDAPLWFWRVWFFGRIPWERRCVPTTSVLLSASLVTVFDLKMRAR